MKCFASLTAALLIALAPALASTQDAIQEIRVQFPRGASSTTLKGVLRGRQTVDYKIRARAGQRMTVDLETDHSGNYFNVLAPGQTNVAFFVGSTQGNRFRDKLQTTGDYTLRVYLVRAAARRNETVRYQLKVAVTGAASGSGDATVPGTEFHATGQIPCARVAGQPMGSCRFGVRRERRGSGWIKVFWPDGGNRVIFYENHTPMRYDQAEADGGARMTVRRQVDLFMVRIGEQRFEIPEAVMTGG
jgi:hypothetical protein